MVKQMAILFNILVMVFVVVLLHRGLISPTASICMCVGVLLISMAIHVTDEEY